MRSAAGGRKEKPPGAKPQPRHGKGAAAVGLGGAPGSVGRERRGPRGAAARPTCPGLVSPARLLRGTGMLLSIPLQRVRRERRSLLPNHPELRLMSYICRGERRGTVFARVLASSFGSGFFDYFCRKRLQFGKSQ